MRTMRTRQAKLCAALAAALCLAGCGSGAQRHAVAPQPKLPRPVAEALARLGELDWRTEAWETLTHELRHHLEWRANVDALAAYDWSAEENFKRHEGEPFDPAFYRSGEMISPKVWKVDDDVFIEREQEAGSGEPEDLVWHGRRYRVGVPAAAPGAPLFLTLDGLVDPPPGDAVLVVKRASRLRDLFRRRPPVVEQTLPVSPLDG